MHSSMPALKQGLAQQSKHCIARFKPRFGTTVFWQLTASLRFSAWKIRCCYLQLYFQEDQRNSEIRFVFTVHKKML